MHKLYGIKNCDTVKKARKWLDQNAIKYQFHDYRVDGLDLSSLEQFAETLGWQNILNCRSSSWRQLNDADKINLDKAKALQLMLKYPTLIKRPVLVTENTLLLGFSESLYQVLR